jgi:hypothetical protein
LPVAKESNLTTLFGELLDIILPHVTHRKVSDEGNTLAMAPKPGWQVKLNGFRDFVRNPQKWGSFARLPEAFANCFAVLGRRHLLPKSLLRKESLLVIRLELPAVFFNEDKKDAILSVFTEKELANLSKSIIDLVSQERRVSRTSDSASDHNDLWKRCAGAFGKEFIGCLLEPVGQWRIDSLR